MELIEQAASIQPQMDSGNHLGPVKYAHTTRFTMAVWLWWPFRLSLRDLLWLWTRQDFLNNSQRHAKGYPAFESSVSCPWLSPGTAIQTSSVSCY